MNNHNTFDSVNLIMLEILTVEKTYLNACFMFVEYESSGGSRLSAL